VPDILKRALAGWFYVHETHPKRREEPMPTYEFVCEKCKDRFSLIMSISEYEKKHFTCPKCNSTDVRQQPTAFHATTSKKS
jgi:putative FmdB family regulatory protein